jgi:hypothetical protein
MSHRIWLLLGWLPLAAGCAAARAEAHATLAAPVAARVATPEASQPDPAQVKALEETIRSLMLKNLPDPLVKSGQNWGHQKEALIRANGMKNDGTWRRFQLRAARPEQSLKIGIKDAAFPEPGRAVFTVMTGVDCDFSFEQQAWKTGLRLYSGETRGRCKAAAVLKCEVTSRTESKPGSFVPDLVFRLKVTEAQLFYDDLVVEHTAGVGGDAARVLGDLAIDTIKKVKPDLERDLLNKANAAIVKAADTKDIRLSLETLLKKTS